MKVHPFTVLSALISQTVYFRQNLEDPEQNNVASKLQKKNYFNSPQGDFQFPELSLF